ERNGWLLRQSNRYLGAARNTAWRAATGEFIMFMDDDNLAVPQMIERLVAVQQHTNADALTSLFFDFEGNALIHPATTWPMRVTAPSGPDVVLGAFVNCFGDANMLVKRSCIERIGGFTEDYGRGHEDWELLLRLSLEGYHIERVLEPLFWYR